MSTALLVLACGPAAKTVSRFRWCLGQLQLPAKVLYVHLVPDQSQAPSAPPISSGVIQKMYGSSFTLRPHLDLRIVLDNLKPGCGTRLSRDWISRQIEAVYLDQSCVQHALPDMGPSVQTHVLLPHEDMAKSETSESVPDPEPRVDHDFVCIGGTFDRIHAGHKVLLSQAVLRCRRRLTVGVTDHSMNRNKTLSPLIKPLEQRMQNVTSFLKDVDPGLTYDVVPLSDPFGPAIIDPTLTLIVGSLETQKGCAKVNDIRREKGMAPLEVDLVGLIQDESHSDIEEAKISSSSLRIRLLGTYLRPPTKKPHLADEPYLIGLTGSSASGKSSIGRRFEKLGAGLINCDSLGHRAYEPGTACYDKVVAAFNTHNDLLGPDSRIQRSILAKKVFSDQEALSRLNAMVWPEIWTMAMSEAQRLHQSGIPVVILDAAVLLAAGWDQHVHQIFATILDHEESVRRVMQRDGLTKDEAEQRLRHQTDAAVLVSKANVVFCTKWAVEVTQAQVEKAWQQLQQFLAHNDSTEHMK